MRRPILILCTASCLPLFLGCQSHKAERYADSYEKSKLGWVRAHHDWFPDWRPPLPNAPLREPTPIYSLKAGKTLVPPPVANPAIAKSAITPTSARPAPALSNATPPAPLRQIAVAPLPIASATTPVTAPPAVRTPPPTRPATPPEPVVLTQPVPVLPAARQPLAQNGLPRAIVDDRRRVTENSPPAVSQSFEIVGQADLGGEHAQPSNLRTHVVRKGETLTKIAKQYYGDANEWRRISRENRGLLKSPTAIQPGMKLRIP
jgi:5'-nucleotidase/UDP-sugar diphosphatase